MPSTSLGHGIELHVDDDATVATLTLWPDADAGCLNVEALSQLIRDTQIVVDDSLAAKLEGAIASVRANATRLDVEIARAILLVEGENGRIEWREGCDPCAATGAREGNDLAKVDYYNQHHYVTAKTGLLLGVLHQPTPGIDGVNVYGKVRKAKPGAALPIKFDNTVAVDAEGQITAARDGILQFRSNLLRILPLFEVPASVNFSTGNIFYAGSVVVRGDICDRFIVQASDDLTVHGLIGAATIICGRNLNANCGMAAHDRGCLFVSVDAIVGYLKNVHGVVHGNLFARRELINCDLAVGQSVLCESGAVIGGTIAVGDSAVVGVLGAPTGTATTLVFGSHPCQKQIEILLRDGHFPGQAKRSQGGADPRIAAVIDQIRACAQQSCEYNTGQTKPVKVTIQKVLHPGVVIKSGRCRVRVNRTMNGPIHIHGDDQSGLFYKVGDEGISRPLADLEATSLRRAG